MALFGGAVTISQQEENRPDIPTDRWLVPWSFGGNGTATCTAGRIYLSPIYVPYDGSYTDFGFSTVAVTAGSYKVGIYEAINGAPSGEVISGSIKQWVRLQQHQQPSKPVVFLHQ